MDQLIKENKPDKKRKAALQDKMEKKRRRMENLSEFKGHPLVPRSDKPVFKPEIVKKDKIFI